MTTATPRPASRPAERYLPLVYFMAALAVVAAIIPSTLRPPPQQANASAEFSPDAPPDDNSDAIISSLQRANSATAGEGPNAEGLDAGVPPAKPGPPRACPRGYGKPPRQVESVYAAPCAGPFTGNNGGATSPGVTANTITLALIMCTNVMATNSGPIDDKATDGNARDKTLRAYQRYFNQNYQFYGRRLQIISLNPKDNGQTCNVNANKARVVEANETYHAFGIMADIGYTYAEAVRRKMMVEAHWTGGAPDYYRKNYPYMFGPTLDVDKLLDAETEFICKQVAGKTADYTDDPNIQGKPRKIGLVAWAGSDWGITGDEIQAALKRRCGVQYDSVVTVDTFDESADSVQTWSSVITKFRAEGITTIQFSIDYVFGGQMANAASAQNYFPEWLVCGCFVWDTNIAIHFFVNSAQWRHAFGFTAREVPRPQPETDWYRAYAEVEPSGEADETTGLVVFPALLQYANGIQMAGPNLTPRTFMEGLFKVPSRTPDPIWSVGGGFSPSDLSYPDHVGFLWWSATDLAPDDANGTGAYRHVYGGKKFRIGEMPTAPVPFFKDGVTGVHGS